MNALRFFPFIAMDGSHKQNMKKENYRKMHMAWSQLKSTFWKKASIT